MTLRLAGKPCPRCIGGQLFRGHRADDASCLMCGFVPPSVNRPSDLWKYLEDREAEELMQGSGRATGGPRTGSLRL